MKKRADGRYSKQVTVGTRDGKPIKKTVYGKTIKEVEKNYRELMILVDKGVILDNQGITMNELIAEWYRIKKAGKVKKNTELTYDARSKVIKDKIGDMKVKDVTMYTIESLITDLEKNNGVTVAKNTLMLLKSAFKYAVNISMVAKNPCNELSVDYAQEDKRVLTDEEKEKVDNAAMLSEKERLFILILRYTGIRRGEVLALSKDDIDSKNMMINIRKTLIDNKADPYIQYQTKSAAGMRQVPIFLPLYKPLTAYVDKLDEGAQLFLNRNKKLMSSNGVYVMFEKIKKRIGLGKDLTIHCFRHTFISECYYAGIDVKKLQLWAGHENIGTTLNIYTKLAKKEIEDGSKMNEFYGSQKEVKSDLENNGIAQTIENTKLRAI